ncbi:MAG: hypothetical protein ABIA04_01560 [Pseudomonadota bacterium]
MNKHFHININNETFHVSANNRILEIRYAGRAGVKTIMTWEELIVRANWQEYAPCRQPKVYRINRLCQNNSQKR